ncbi:MAG: hypothetical protein GY794_00965, partial [bacterium]|nr:hypothetical protein [bacterium]
MLSTLAQLALILTLAAPLQTATTQPADTLQTATTQAYIPPYPPLTDEQLKAFKARGYKHAFIIKADAVSHPPKNATTQPTTQPAAPTTQISANEMLDILKRRASPPDRGMSKPGSFEVRMP